MKWVSESVSAYEGGCARLSEGAMMSNFIRGVHFCFVSSHEHGNLSQYLLFFSPGIPNFSSDSFFFFFLSQRNFHYVILEQVRNRKKFKCRARLQNLQFAAFLNHLLTVGSGKSQSILQA